jgi:hypothetical protein
VTASREKNKKILYDRLTTAERTISEMMQSCALTSEDKISLLLNNMQVRLQGIESAENGSLSELQDIYVNLIIGVMAQDMLESSDQIEMLCAAVRKRIDNFNSYFEQLQTGTFNGPF